MSRVCQIEKPKMRGSSDVFEVFRTSGKIRFEIDPRGIFRIRPQHLCQSEIVHDAIEMKRQRGIHKSDHCAVDMDFRPAFDDTIQMIGGHCTTVDRPIEIERRNAISSKGRGGIGFQGNGGSHCLPVRSMTGKLRFGGNGTFVTRSWEECRDVKVRHPQSRMIPDLFISEIEDHVARCVPRITGSRSKCCMKIEWCTDIG